MSSRTRRRPLWLKEQRGLRYDGSLQSGYEDRFALVEKFARELERDGVRVTHKLIREMLIYVNRGYKTDSQSISRLLHYRSTSQHEHYANGHRVKVSVDGETKIFKSLGEAAEKMNCSKESVRKWAASRRPNRRGQTWSYEK